MSAGVAYVDVQTGDAAVAHFAKRLAYWAAQRDAPDVDQVALEWHIAHLTACYQNAVAAVPKTAGRWLPK